MRHPLTGGGMTVALSDCHLLTSMLQPLPSFSDAVATALRTSDFYTRRKPVAATINTLANALYKVFSYTGGGWGAGPGGGGGGGGSLYLSGGEGVPHGVCTPLLLPLLLL